MVSKLTYSLPIPTSSSRNLSLLSEGPSPNKPDDKKDQDINTSWVSLCATF